MAAHSEADVPACLSRLGGGQCFHSVCGQSNDTQKTEQNSGTVISSREENAVMPRRMP